MTEQFGTREPLLSGPQLFDLWRYVNSIHSPGLHNPDDQHKCPGCQLTAILLQDKKSSAYRKALG